MLCFFESPLIAAMQCTNHMSEASLYFICICVSTMSTIILLQYEKWETDVVA